MRKARIHRFRNGIAAGLAVVLGAGVLVTSTPTNERVVSAASTCIQNNTFWKDTNGNNIYSQGGGIFLFGDTYYWYGVKYNGAITYAKSPTSKNSDTSFNAVTCYSSKDLVNWKYENDVLTSKTKDFGFAYWFGRLGVAYNPTSKRYVLVSQYNDSVMFASCDSPTGNFKVERVQDQITNVLKQGTGDQTVFVDDDGKAYLICSNKGGRGHQYVVPLRASDYLAAEPAIEVAKGSGREGNCMFKYKGKYYFCASDLHGWNASHTYYMVADKITGPYSAWAVMPGTDEDFSHVTQTGFFVTVHGSKQETVLYCGDRWSDFAGNGIGYNQWVPLSVTGTKPFFHSMSEWNLNAQTGEWTVGAGNNYLLNPSFDADRVSQTALAGWTSSGSGNGNASGARTGRFCMQQWADTAFNGKMTQTASLPNGTYTLKGWVKSSGGQKSSRISVDGYGGTRKDVSLNRAIGSWTEITIPEIAVTNGTCRVEIASEGNSGNWVKVDDLTLIGDGGGSVVTPPAVLNGQLIQALTVQDTGNAAAWSIQQNLKVGDRVFGDRAFTLQSVPSELAGAEWIQTACNSKKCESEEAQFQIAKDATVSVGLDSRIETPPTWLADWTKSSLTLQDDGDPVVTYQVYQKNYAAGSTVVLGVNGATNVVNYLVAVQEAKPLTSLQGDVDCSGTLDVADAILLSRFVAEDRLVTVTEQGMRNADCTGAGTINSEDVTWILKKIAGLI